MSTAMVFSSYDFSEHSYTRGNASNSLSNVHKSSSCQQLQQQQHTQRTNGGGNINHNSSSSTISNCSSSSSATGSINMNTNHSNQHNHNANNLVNSGIMNLTSSTSQAAQQAANNAYSMGLNSIERKSIGPVAAFQASIPPPPPHLNVNLNGVIANINSQITPANLASRRLMHSTSVSSVTLLSNPVQPRSVRSVSAPVGSRNITGSTNTLSGQTTATTTTTVISHHSGLTYSMSVNNAANASNKEHKKLDRSFSEPADKLMLTNHNSSNNSNGQQQRSNQANSSRYKTELCRPFEENGTCKYGDKCQFAHGYHELRNLQRHPKYKTELCRTFHTTGFCPYGPRCHFIHNSEESKKSMMSTLQASCPSGGGSQSRTEVAVANNDTVASPGSIPAIGTAIPYPNTGSIRPKALSLGSYSLGSSGDLSPPSSPSSSSPTSLSSFFPEDSPLGNYTSLSSGNTAFSFSPDFSSLVGHNISFNNSNNNNNNNQNNNSTNRLNSLNSSSNRKLGVVSSNCVQLSSFSEKSSGSLRPRSVSYPARTIMPMDGSAVKCSTSPPIGSSYPITSSPVDSLGSELDILSLGGGSSPLPSSSSPSPLDSARSTVPRLPIFTRFANMGNDSD